MAITSGEFAIAIATRRADLPDSAVDDDMSDVDALRRQLPRHALREATQRKLAHRERGRLREPLDPSRSTGE